MKIKKRLVSLVLGLALMLTGIIGPYAMSAVSGAEGNFVASLGQLTDAEKTGAILKNLKINGEITGDLTEELSGSKVVLTFINEAITDSTKTSETRIEFEGALSVISTTVPVEDEPVTDNEPAGEGSDTPEDTQTEGLEEAPQGEDTNQEGTNQEDINQDPENNQTTVAEQTVITATFEANVKSEFLREEYKELTFKLEKIEIVKDGEAKSVTIPSEEFKFTVASITSSEEDQKEDEDNAGNTTTEEENTPQITFSEVKFYNGTSAGVQQISQNENTKINFSFKATSNAVDGGKINVTATVRRGDTNGTIIETVIPTEGENNLFAGTVTVPYYSVNGNDYFVVISASQGEGESAIRALNSDLMITSIKTSQDDTPTVDLQMERVLTSAGQIGNDNGQIFTEGSTVTYTVRSKNSDVTFTSENVIATITKSSDGSNVGTLTLALVKAGNYSHREYAVTFNAQAPLNDGDSYKITVESFPYSLRTGGKGTVPSGYSTYKTETNKPYIAAGELKATYVSSPNSTTAVTPSALVSGNVVNLETSLMNDRGVYSITVDYTNTSSMTGKDFSITLTRVGSTNKFKGSYTITTNNNGFTYNYSKATYKTSANGENIALKNNSSTSGLSFTVGTHQHTYSNTYSYDENKHWNNSNCTNEHPGQTFRMNEANHTLRSSVTNSASQTASGTITYTCTICGYKYNATIPSGGAVLSATILENLEKVANGSRVAIVYSTDYVVSKNVFDALKGTNKELELINQNGVSWIFKGTDITGTTKPINLDARISSLQSNTGVNAAGIKNLVGTQPTIVIDFPENGELPGKATVRVPLNTSMLNTLGGRNNIKVQYYNPAANRLENIATIAQIPAGNYIEFAITHNSSYIITREVVGENGDNNNSNNNNSDNTNSGNAGNNSSSNANGNGNNSGNSGNTNGNSSSNGGNKKPTTTTTTTTIVHRVSPKTLDGNYTWLWIAAFVAGALLVISSLCMTRFEEE